MSLTKAPTFSIISLGCARSLVDSENMVDALQKTGFNLVPEGSKEQVTVLTTCSFIQSAIEETERNIELLVERKKKGLIKHVAVVGCYVSRFKKPDLEAKYPDVDLWLSTQEEHVLQTELMKLVFQKTFQPQSNYTYAKLTPSHFAYLKISEGCNNWCSFCTIPKIRGVHTSKPIDQVLKEAEKYIQFGAQELLVIAEDTTCWGEDLYGKPSLDILMKELGQLPVKWIRPMYIFPSRVNEKLIESLVAMPNLCPYIDMPIQHVNSDLLKAMNRAHDKKHLQTIISWMKQAIPNLALRTTFISGFPGETEDHVDELIDFLEETQFAQVGCFAYSEEKETRSARFENKIDSVTVRKRMNKIMKKQQGILKSLHRSWKGETVDMVYEGDGWGRSFREAPDVDGRLKLMSPFSHLKPGQFYKVKLGSSLGYDMEVTLV